MKKLFIFAAILLWVGCSNSGNVKSNGNNGGADTSAVANNDTLAQQDATGATAEKGVTEAINGIYAEVFGWYKKAEKDVTLLNKAPNFEARFMSASYNALLVKVKKVDAPLEADGEVGFFDSDHWVCGQDFGDLRAEVKTVTVSGDKANATVAVSNLGTENTVGLELVKENGQWKIDDMRIGGSSERASMKRYVDSKGQSK